MYIWLILVAGLVITIIIVVDMPLDADSGQFSGAPKGLGGNSEWKSLRGKWEMLVPKVASENCSKQLDRQVMGKWIPKRFNRLDLFETAANTSVALES